MSEARLWKLLRNSEAQPKFTLSYKKKIRVWENKRKKKQAGAELGQAQV